MTFDDPADRYATKRDRLARLLRVVAVLRGNLCPDGAVIKASAATRRKYALNLVRCTA